MPAEAERNNSRCVTLELADLPCTLEILLNWMPAPSPIDVLVPSPNDQTSPAGSDAFSLALDAAGLGFWVFRPDLDQLVVSETCRRMWALPARSFSLGAWLALMPVDARDVVRARIEDALQAGQNGEFKCEFQLARIDGSARVIAAHGRVEDTHQAHRRLVGVFQDVTAARAAARHGDGPGHAANLAAPANDALQADAGDNFLSSDARNAAIVSSIDQMIWSTRPDGHHDYFNQRWYDYTGVPVGSTDGKAWNGLFHPDDQARTWEVWRRCLETGEPYHIEYRLRHRSGAYRWVLGRAHCVRDRSGAIARWYGTCTDIHDARTSMELNDLLSRELSHRIKNIFAIMTGLITQSVRRHPEAKPFANVLRERIVALARAHEFVRPHGLDSAPMVTETTLHGVCRALLSAYPAFGEGRLVVEGDDVAINDRGATPIGLLIHELATNAMKYGALSALDGRVNVTITDQFPHLLFEWTESGGPAVGGEPAAMGFGTRLTEIAVVDQLGGSLERLWSPEGLVVRALIRQKHLNRPTPGAPDIGS
jgi:PAS domain S-box-containing protein